MNLSNRTALVAFAQDSDTPSFSSITAAVLYAAHIVNETSADPVGVYEIPFEDLIDFEEFDTIELTADDVVLPHYADGIYCKHLLATPDIELAFAGVDEDADTIVLSQILAIGKEDCPECQAYLELIGQVPAIAKSA